MTRKDIIVASGVQLDSLVANAAELIQEDGCNYRVAVDDKGHLQILIDNVLYNPHENWQLVGNIIERYGISVAYEKPSDYSPESFWFAGFLNEGSWDFYAESKLSPHEAVLRSFLLFKDASCTSNSETDPSLSSETKTSTCPTSTENGLIDSTQSSDSIAS